MIPHPPLDHVPPCNVSLNYQKTTVKTTVEDRTDKGYSLPIRPIYSRDGLDPPLFRDSARRRRPHPPQGGFFLGFWFYVFGLPL